MCSRFAARYHITFFEETHGDSHDLLELQRTFDEHILYGTFLDRSAGGIVVAIRLDFAEHFESIPFQELVPGRIGRLCLDGKKGSLNCVGIHLEPNLPADDARAQLQCRTSTLQERMDVTSFLVGDFNFTPYEEERYNPVAQSWTNPRFSVAEWFLDHAI